MKKRITLISFLFLCLLSHVFAQDRYSIDIKQKERRVPIKYFITEIKTKIVDAHKWRKKTRINNRDSRKTRKRMYTQQTRKTKKRMKVSRRVAKVFNRGKLPLSVKLRQIIYKWTK